MKMVGLKAERYSWNSLFIHYCVKTTAKFNKSIVLGNQSELIITRQLVSSLFLYIYILILHFLSVCLAYSDSGSCCQPVWINRATYENVEKQTHHKMIWLEMLWKEKKKRNTNNGMQCKVTVS